MGFVLPPMLEDTTLPSNMAAKTKTSLYLVKSLIVTLQFGVNTATEIKAQNYRSERCHSQIKKSHSGHLTRYEITHLEKMTQVCKIKLPLFCLKNDS